MNAPVCISQFVNKNIKQVAAYKTSSACFAENNDYYAWGGSVYDAEIQPQSHVKDKISSIQVGNGFKAILTEVGDLYVWGEVKNSKSEKIFAFKSMLVKTYFMCPQLPTPSVN